ncbi:MAG TPA: winged helix DNA-binding domain-containing protein [Actinocrinis sp.]|uniref:winged helix DNA-binding domain-containing protein n=1 Tax=Actinocrinis sp. TaxID=1920516 RepID=UPI002D6C904D|nr:winged helix DNA-binding domain-containing protein [Actinocrinis sp.]HZU56437.1 winged helix DNA-binding domain-containing protein [Actinocrinis sp.]
MTVGSDRGAEAGGAGSGAVLDERTLNRTLVRRQLLDARVDRPVADAVEYLVGLHAQIPPGPYFALWARLVGFVPEVLSELVAQRAMVRIALMRSTIHLVTADDCMRLRSAVQPVLDRDLLSNSAHGRAAKTMDLAKLADAGRRLLDEQPRSPGELGKRLQEQWPEVKPETLAYAVRNLVGLVQIPPRGLWGGSGQPVHATAEHWLGRSAPDRADVPSLVLRYLAAFGPASVADVQAWCGLTKLAEVVERLRPRLVAYRDAHGRELFDVPDGVIADPDTPAPPRFLPEYDNVFLSHADRARIIPGGLSFAQSAKKYGFFLSARGGVARGMLLLDGYLGGTWRIERDAKLDAFTVFVEPFETVSRRDLAAVEAEGDALLAFYAPQAGSRRTEVAAARA